jgi:hypothetical protein
MIASWTLAVMVALGGQFGQTNSGELRLTVVDAAGLPLESTVELISEANQIREHLNTTPDGALVAKRLPFGSYRVVVGRDGFATCASSTASISRRAESIRRSPSMCRQALYCSTGRRAAPGCRSTFET